MIEVADDGIGGVAPNSFQRAAMEYRHVDVFADRPYSGNGLIVFFGGIEREAKELQALTTEMRQFESIFLGEQQAEGEVSARIFTAQEELDFAGHPIIGAAAAAHERWRSNGDERRWTFLVGGRSIEVKSRREGRFYRAMMNQGRAILEDPLDESSAADFLSMLGLSSTDRHQMPVQVVSTGLPYLIVPVTPAGLERARISIDDFEAHLFAVGAKLRLRVRSRGPRGTHMGQRRRGRGRRDRERRGSSCCLPLGARPHRRFGLLSYAGSLCRKAELDVS